MLNELGPVQHYPVCYGMRRLLPARRGSTYQGQQIQPGGTACRALSLDQEYLRIPAST